MGDTRFKKGRSGNPTGRPKVAEEFRARARKAVDEKVLQAWIDELEIKERTVITPAGSFEIMSRGKEWMRASENLAAYGYGKPTQPVVNLNPEQMSDAELRTALLGLVEQWKQEGLVH